MSSTGKWEAKSTASFDFPEAVGPVMTSSFGFGFGRSLLLGFEVTVLSVAAIVIVNLSFTLRSPPPSGI